MSFSIGFPLDFLRLASFSTSQLTAFDAIRNGGCPYLSRAVRCRGASPRGLRRLRRLASAYLEEEAHLARRQVLASGHGIKT